MGRLKSKTKNKKVMETHSKEFPTWVKGEVRSLLYMQFSFHIIYILFCFEPICKLFASRLKG